MFESWKSALKYFVLRIIVFLSALCILITFSVLYGNDIQIHSIIKIIHNKQNTINTCETINPFSNVIHRIDNGYAIITNDNTSRVLNFKLDHVYQITAFTLSLGIFCPDCDYVDIEIRVGYDHRESKNNAVCAHKYITQKERKNDTQILCYTCPLYGDKISIRLSGYYSSFEMNQINIYGYNSPRRCSIKPKCNLTASQGEWHQWIDTDVDLTRTFESLAEKYLHPWLSLAAHKKHQLGDEGLVEPLKLYEEYPLISPLDITASYGNFKYMYFCRLRWNQRYLDNNGTWKLKLTFNSSDVELISSPYLGITHGCDELLRQFRYIVDNSPRESLPDYMDINYQFGDFPNMPLIHLSNSAEPNDRRSQSKSLLPNWLTTTNGFLGRIDYYTLNNTIPLLDIPPPMLSHCTTDEHRDIPWLYFQKWTHESVDGYLKKLASKIQETEDCSSKCDTFYEWHTRRRQAVWRGSPSAVYPDIKLAGNWRHHQRVELREQSLYHPDIVDAQFLYCSLCSNETRYAIINALGPFVEGFDYKEYIQSLLYYQGLVDIDGVTWSSRFSQLLSQGAVVFKQESIYKEWWYDLLIPGTHYIPLSHDMIDTAEKIKSILSDEEKSKRIAMNSARFASTYLTMSSCLKYSQILLRAYSSLLIKPWHNHSQLNFNYLFQQSERIRKEYKAFSI